jgi:hypothetical protein
VWAANPPLKISLIIREGGERKGMIVYGYKFRPVMSA